MKQCPRLTELPAPPNGFAGWPWTAESRAPIEGRNDWPVISIVTPSFNQGEFLEATIRSVLLQGYPKLEYIVMDGGSTDGSRALIERYMPWLSHWQSAPDQGQYDAINQGLARSSGSIMAWLNSDDMYAPNALHTVAEAMTAFPDVRWLTGIAGSWDRSGMHLSLGRPQLRPRWLIRRGCYQSGMLGWLQQEVTFWHRTLWNETGGCLRDDLAYASDFELWLRFAEAAELYPLAMSLGGIRRHGNQKTTCQENYRTEVAAVVADLAGKGWRRLLSVPEIRRILRPLLRLTAQASIIRYNCVDETWQR
jgi:hypothetical protein